MPYTLMQTIYVSHLLTLLFLLMVHTFTKENKNVVMSSNQTQQEAVNAVVSC